MKETKDVFDKYSVKVTTTFLQGNPARSIIDAAKKNKVDLLVVGATGHGGVPTQLFTLSKKRPRTKWEKLETITYSRLL